MICKCGNKMTYENNKYHCEKCRSDGIPIYEVDSKTVIGKWGLNNFGKNYYHASKEGFKPGILYCVDGKLSGHLCSQCMDNERCEYSIKSSK